MMWKISTKMGAIAWAFAAFCVVASVFAQDEGQAAGQAGEQVAEGGQGPAAADKVFTSLFKFKRARGVVEVRRPDDERWEAAVEGRYYPLGSSVRTRPEAGASAKVEVAFGAECLLLAEGAVEFATRPVEIGENSRTVELRSGRIDLDLPQTLKDGLFFVAAPYFTCSDMSGKSWFVYNPTGDGDETRVCCKTGTMTLNGRHYKIARMTAANQVCIRSTADA